MNSFSYDSSSTTTGFVTGWDAVNSTTNITIDAAAVFLFNSGANNVYVYIPFTQTLYPDNADVVDLTSAKAPSNSLSSWTGIGTLTPFNFFDQTDFNQWFTVVVGTNTVLISKFVYSISNTGAAASTPYGPAISLVSKGWTTAVRSTGDKLCYSNVTLIKFSSKLI